MVQRRAPAAAQLASASAKVPWWHDWALPPKLSLSAHGHRLLRFCHELYRPLSFVELQQRVENVNAGATHLVGLLPKLEDFPAVTILQLDVGAEVGAEVGPDVGDPVMYPGTSMLKPGMLLSSSGH
jgi:hypothetical protein